MLRASADELLLQVVQATPDTDLGHVDSHALPAGIDEAELSLGSGSLVSESECLADPASRFDAIPWKISVGRAVTRSDPL